MIERCVKCGKVLDDNESMSSSKAGYPGACFSHLIDVVDEVEKNFPVWPSDWFGHWCANDETESWIFDEAYAKE